MPLKAESEKGKAKTNSPRFAPVLSFSAFRLIISAFRFS
jgi:hypothetical protein